MVRMQPRTIREYKLSLARALDSAGALKPEVKAWGRSACIVLRAALMWSAEQGERSKSEAQALRDQVPSYKGKRRTRATAPNVGMVAAFCDEAAKEDPDKCALALLPYYMAFRASELISLTRPRVIAALKHGELTFIRKGGKTATLPLSDSAREQFKALVEYEWNTLGDLLSGGTPKSQLNAYEMLIKEIGSRIDDDGLKFDWHPHALRHAFARKMLKNGATLKQIQAWLGHENVATTDIYLGAGDPTEGLDFVPK